VWGAYPPHNYHKGVKMKEQFLTKNLKLSEVVCRCGCGYDGISYDLCHMFQKARDLFGEAIIVKSGCRCAKRNFDVGGLPTSSHLSGVALDLTCRNPTVFRLMKLAHCLTKAGFTRIGYNEAKKFIHVDIDKSKKAAFFSY